MPAYQYEREHTPPEATRITDVAITRHEHVYEVDPDLMRENVTQQTFPSWDTWRIVHGRADHLAWMHRHWAGEVISAQELLDGVNEDGASGAPSSLTGPPPESSAAASR